MNIRIIKYWIRIGDKKIILAKSKNTRINAKGKLKKVVNHFWVIRKSQKCKINCRIKINCYFQLAENFWKKGFQVKHHFKKKNMSRLSTSNKVIRFLLILYNTNRYTQINFLKLFYMLRGWQNDYSGLNSTTIYT